MFEKKFKFLLGILVISISISFLTWANVISFGDMDDDGIIDSIDNCPRNFNQDQEDSDFDKIGNYCDSDDDNDGIVDFLDSFDIEPLDWADFDFDGIGNSKDEDDDNDGILDSEDSEPILASEILATKYLDDIQDCANINDDTSRHLCYTVFFGKITKNEQNNSNALELSIALSKIGAIDDCHFVSHEIGHVAFEENPNVISNLIGMDGTMCRGGYFHGVLASYFHSIKEHNESFPSDYNLVCNELIGSSNYQDCVHGLGHGLVHYFGNDLDSSLELCHEMSFYQNILCVKGVMMQYTDNTMTQKGISQNVVSDLCDESQLEKLDFIECSMSLGTTLSFFNNHDYDKSSKFCEYVENEKGQSYCLDGLRLEISDSENYKTKPLTEEIREKFQPQFESDYVIDIRSPAIVSNFDHIQEIDLITFSIDSPQYVIMYVPSEFVSSDLWITVNGQIPNNLVVKNNILDEEITMFSFVPKTKGIVMISPFSD
ncbi:MAG: thrombospondin type 3 repeat-containing protein [Nitrosopumilus sp.]|uniref:thrombospondin type 3 repeat-containing protein n=1 Tax=Nitrosopumilus sp. TaxID=2024843 RepID=UPI00247E8CF4|nr:thrombospondin type 3 repeat-containing protein [Nitrosopumilus sp.]MCV0393113.1 thrombospondin type 3 repeat-containing protein [Nitrosopumilus sp.]